MVRACGCRAGNYCPGKGFGYGLILGGIGLLFGSTTQTPTYLAQYGVACWMISASLTRISCSAGARFP